MYLVAYTKMAQQADNILYLNKTKLFNMVTGFAALVTLIFLHFPKYYSTGYTFPRISYRRYLPL
jgi:hypothetical protein